MTISSEINRSGPYTGNSVTTIFDYEFRVVDKTHLKVIRTGGGIEAALTVDVDYTVSGVGDAGGGSITMVTPPTATQTIAILRNLPFTQETDLFNQGPFFAETIEDALDLAVMRDQQLRERQDRSIHFPDGDPMLASELASAATRKNKLLGFGTDGEIIYPSGPNFGGGALNVATADSRATAQVTTFDASVNVLVTGGYQAAGDNGGALYKRVGAAPSHAGKFQSADGAWWEITGREIRPEMVGGVINAANSTTGVQNAIDVAIAIGSRVLVSGNGVWNVGNLSVTASLNIDIDGAARLKLLGNQTGDMFAITGTGTKVTFRGPGTIDGNRANQTAPVDNRYLIRSTADGNAVTPHVLDVAGVQFVDAAFGAIGFYADADATTWERLVVQNCSFIGLTEGTPQDGTDIAPRFISIVDGAEGVFTDNYFDLGYGAGTTGSSAILVQGTATSPIHDNTVYIAGNTFRRLGRQALNALGVVDFYIWGAHVVITGNRFLNSVSTPIRGKADGRNVIVSDNTIETVLNGREGISITSTAYNNGQAVQLVHSNVMSSINGVGILLAGDGITGDVQRGVRNNIVRQCGSHGIYILGITTIDVCGNQVSLSSGNGIKMDACLGACNVNGNNVSTSSNEGLIITNASGTLNISDNMIVGSVAFGMYVTASGTCKVTAQDNVVDTVTSGTCYAFGPFSQLSVRGNSASGGFTLAASVDAGTVNLYYEGNTWQRRVYFGAVAPTTGAHSQNDVVWNSACAASGNIGWVCTTAGTPGTWKAFGTIAA